MTEQQTFKKFKLGIMTVDRVSESRGLSKRPNGGSNPKPANYINRTIESFIKHAQFGKIREENWDLRIFESGSQSLDYLDYVREKFPQFKLSRSPTGERLSLNQNANRLLEWASTNSDFAILMQDDIIFQKDSFFKIVPWIKNRPQDAALLTLWNPISNKQGNYISIPPESFWSSVFLIFPSHEAQDYLKHKTTRKIGFGHDMSVKQWAIMKNKKIYANPQGLIDHHGHFSSIGHRKERTNSQFKPNA